MELWRKKNTDTRIVFPIVKNDGTFITGATGLDSEYALLGAHGAGAPSFSDCEHEASEIGSTGLYYLDVAAGELNGDYGAVIQTKSSSTGALTQVMLIRTFAEEVDTVKVNGTAQTAGDLAALITAVDDYVDTEVGALTTELAKVPKSDSTVSWNATALAAINAEVDTALNTAIPGSPTANSVNERIAALDDHVTADYGSTEKSAIDLLDDASGGLADIHTDVGTALTNIGTPVNTGGTATIAAILGDPANSSLVARMTAVPAAVWAVATSTLTGAGTIGKRLMDFVTTLVYAEPPAAAPTAASIADAVWDEASTGHTDTGKAGAKLWTDVPAILADTDELQTNQGDWLTATGFSTFDPTTDDVAVVNLVDLCTANSDMVAAAPAAASVADAVWDEALSGHATGGSAGAALTGAGSAGDPWSATLPGAYGAGTAGKIVGDNINAPIATVDTVVDAIKLKTDNLPSDPADESLLEAAITAAIPSVPTAAVVADAVWDEATSGHQTTGTAGKALTDAGASGTPTVDFTEVLDAIAALSVGEPDDGRISWDYVLTDGDDEPIADAAVWVTSDEEGRCVVAAGNTDETGTVSLYVRTGTVYVWARKHGWVFDNPDEEVVA
jgi:hypothetical protein